MRILLGVLTGTSLFFAVKWTLYPERKRLTEWEWVWVMLVSNLVAVTLVTVMIWLGYG